MVMVLYASINEVKSNKVRALHKWWLDNRGEDIPDRPDLDPLHLRSLLPYLFISDVEHQPFRIRYRLIGSRATEATGMDLTGRYLDELLPSKADPWMDFYRQAYISRAPVFGAVSASTGPEEMFTYEFGLFPIRNRGRTIELFVALEDYFDLTADFFTLKQWREKNAAQDLKAPEERRRK